MAFSPGVVCALLECLEGGDKGEGGGAGEELMVKGWLTYEIIRVSPGLSHWTLWLFLTDQLLCGFQP